MLGALMATNDFLVFGGGSSPNVIDQPSYAALAARLAGFQSGTALSAQLNKVWRQSSIMAAVLAQFTANFSGQNSVDDGTTATLLANLQAAINAAGITAQQFDSSTSFATTAFVQRALGNYAGASVVSASSTLTKAAAGQIIELNGSSTFTTTLPLSATVAVGGRMAFINQSGVDQNIATQGTESVWSYLGGLVSSVVLHSGDSLELISRGGQWDISGGSVALRYVQGASTQTPQQFDSSSKFATTAFVKQAGVSFSSVQGIATTASLNSGHVGALIWAYGAGSTITLPPVAGVPNGATVTIGTPVGVTVKSNALETITNQYGAGSNTLALNAGEEAQFVSNGGAWYLSSYTTVLGTTPPQFDSTTKLSTTAFVQRAIGNFSGFVLATSATTLTAAAAGQLIELNGGSTFTTTLPVGSSVVQGGKMAFVNQSNSNQTIATQGSDSIWSYAGGLVSSMVLRPGDSLELVSRAGQWDICGGSALLQYSSSFGSSIGTSGYQKLPSGLIVQWGAVAAISANSSLNVTYPIAFPNGVFTNTATAGALAVGAAQIAGVNLFGTGNSKTGFTAWNSSSSAPTQPGTYIATGW
ncbi:hypothetical protein P350_11160 [Burkholderia cepacia JBK9]|nr:hypothetical protein P350_11160 [Burkholderia cepacia JBK9]